MIHAWFSAQTALRDGSSMYRKPGGDTVNVTRLNVDRESKGSFYNDDIYLGEVVSQEDGGCVRERQRVHGST
jgi:hypothetical protein